MRAGDMVRVRNRALEGDKSVWDANAWDDVPWTEEDERRAQERINAQLAAAPMLGEEDAVARVVSGPAAARWDDFYGRHDRWFFRDRKWLADEFPGLVDAEVVVEIGCGVGNTVFPLVRARRCRRGLCTLPDHHVDGLHVQVGNTGMRTDLNTGNRIIGVTGNEPTDANSNENDIEQSACANVQESHIRPGDMGHVYACDFSAHAIDLLRGHREYDPAVMSAFVYDITCAEEPETLARLRGTVDAIVAVFVLSALDPAALPAVFARLAALLRPGTGRLYVRDYAAKDMTQLRFRPERLVRPGLYVRGDGTAVHYFSEDEARAFAEAAGMRVAAIGTDRRMLVNRSSRVTMLRCWLQAEFVRL